MCKFLAMCLITFSLAAADTTEIAKISEAMGHLIGKNLKELGLPLDIDALMKGVNEATLGKESPLSEEDCIEALVNLQDESYAKAAEKNLAEANLFIKDKTSKEGIVLVEGKLLYEIMKNGVGNIVESYSKPLVRIKSASFEEEEILDLDETITGLKKGVIGMKEGEIRTLYIHPDFGYGEEASEPNALLIFEVEVIKADATTDSHSASNGFLSFDLNQLVKQ
ncbi:MAG TPA: FKBP-type peptidyl-prolyl cis-trans isomerase N-terminal domain-containing protein [Chlamydiales bacterium]|nr:FKBP-type peptidyl-prolyl cis-trans isomerase N-terminal domain-containing protein [Chlamydiales bacterium]